jgi:hypothetical protein
VDLQERMIALVWTIGLHKPDESPCRKPVSVVEAHALKAGAPWASPPHIVAASLYAASRNGWST